MSADRSCLEVYSVFGITMTSDFAFESRLVKTDASPELSFRCIDQSPIPEQWHHLTPNFDGSSHGDAKEEALQVIRLTECDVLRFGRIVDFYLWPDRIQCRLLDSAQHYQIEIALLGIVLAFWLERMGVPTLHASSVIVDGKAIGFSSSNFGGKTSLAATFIQSGYPMLTDDVLPIERVRDRILARPGYPTMRLWPNQAQHFLGGYENLMPMHPQLAKRRVPIGQGVFGNFCDTAKPLAVIYLPERRSFALGSTDIEIQHLSPSAAVVQLVRHSFAPRVVHELGWQSHRLDLFADLVQLISVRRVVYPDGFEYLPRVRDCILEDLRSGGG